MVKVEMEYEKGFFKNLESLYEKLKKTKEKRKSAEKALEEFLKKKEKEEKEREKESKILKWDKRWYDLFYWSKTYKGKLIIGGKNKEQNEELFSRYFESNDLFFHADIIGGSVVILKNGKESDEQERMEAAQFSICFSKAWREGYNRLSSYCLEKEGVKKQYNGKKAEKGSFFIVGKREWYKNLPLSLRAGFSKEGFIIVPSYSKIELEKEYLLKPGRIKKEEVVKVFVKEFKESKEKISSLLPSGRFHYKKNY